jgi:HAD superfamily hydrolase (TIGR01490 family)
MNGARNSRAEVAAFFDLDGTLVRPPSLELRFFAELRKRRLIRTRNYLLWLAHAAKLLPRGIKAIQHANKMYLRGVGADYSNEQVEMAGLYAAGMERLAWHAEQGHAIFLISGTLAPLAQRVALQIVLRLMARGVTANIGVCATRLEKRDGCWTGRILGEAMYGEAKARALRWLAQEHRFALERCYAYGNEANDRWMLEAVGRPAAVNPSSDLERIARRNGWPILRWGGNQELRQRAQRTQGSQRRPEIFVRTRDLG